MSATPINMFKLFETPEMVDLIVRETNRKAAGIIRNWNTDYLDLTAIVWPETKETETYVFIELLLACSIRMLRSFGSHTTIISIRSS